MYDTQYYLVKLVCIVNFVTDALKLLCTKNRNNS